MIDRVFFQRLYYPTCKVKPQEGVEIMRPLKEHVSISTPLGIIHGELYVGRDHLPELEVSVLDSWGNERRFTPSSFPDAWTLEQAEPSEVILLHTWLAISEMQSEIAAAQREEEKQ